MRPNELTPILLKPSSTSSPRLFFLAYLPRILAWSLAGFILINWLSWVGVYDGDVLKRPQPPNTEPFVLPNYISHNLGPYTPWYPLRRYRSPPKQCEVTQVSGQDVWMALCFPILSSSSPLRPSLQETDCPIMPTHVRYLKGQSGELILRNTVASVAKYHSLYPFIQLHRHGSRFPTSGLDRNIRLALSKIQAVGKYRSSKLNFLGDYKYSLKTSDLLPYGASE